MPSIPAKPPRLPDKALYAGYESQRVLDDIDLTVTEGKHIHRRNMREVAQDPVAPEGLAARQLDDMGCFPHQWLWRQDAEQDIRTTREAMAYADVTELDERSVDALSGAQRQRCWIAMVLIHENGRTLTAGAAPPEPGSSLRGPVVDDT
ncbi:ABC transporter ATP-binding protein [Chromohalobacter sp.]|uniref:ABC transporter ATP-binding protein n=1 Tax=Chromohalobacter sp. TaxID=50740 RepID=UPI00257F70A2|nr:ABC transporter ATP-binding protein [Chromohalobacter sp.]